jgi:16S rRNA (guanine527-N7)-methyltransferase
MRSRKQNDLMYDIGRDIAELEKGMDELGIVFDPAVRERFKVYLEVLHSYHGKVHLLSHRDYKRISRRHFLPSLLVYKDSMYHKQVCDVGSGPGFPSVPLKILLPHLELVIFEAQRKKADFLNYLVERLELERVEIVNARAEMYAGAKFDLALLRAVGTIRKLIAVLDSLLAPKAEAIFWKTLRVEKEIEEAQETLHQRNFQVSIRKTLTPLDKSPLALVILRKS